MRLILVPTADRPESVLALDTAFNLADRLGANVAGCHVRAERFEQPSGSTGPKSSHLTQYLANWDIKVERVRGKGHDVRHDIERAYRRRRAICS
jgi:hypothetical protein